MLFRSCHVTLGCRHFTTQCQHCRLLPGGGSRNDFSTTIWQKKRRMLESENIYFVACSHWLESEAKKSALLKGQKVASVPNPIDTHIYKKGDKLEARQRLGLPLDRKLTKVPACLTLFTIVGTYLLELNVRKIDEGTENDTRMVRIETRSGS